MTSWNLTPEQQKLHNLWERHLIQPEAVVILAAFAIRTPRTPEQQKLHDLWERHLMCEFATHDTEETLATMVLDAYVITSRF